MNITLILSLSFSIIIGIIIGRFILPKPNGSFTANIFEMFKSDTSDDNLDRTITLVGSFCVAIMILVLVFATDWFFERQILTDTVIGILIGTSLAWITAAVTHFFRSSSTK